MFTFTYYPYYSGPSRSVDYLVRLNTAAVIGLVVGVLVVMVLVYTCGLLTSSLIQRPCIRHWDVADFGVGHADCRLRLFVFTLKNTLYVHIYSQLVRSPGSTWTKL